MTIDTSKTSTLREQGETAHHLASHVLKSAEQAYDTTRNFADESLDQAQRFARRGMDAASDAGAKAQKTLARYADSTGEYVANQPMKSLLIAAAAGAAIATLLLSVRHRNGR
ncbi:hypothetical protein [Rhodoferax sediminis]|jgi:ElaB/YqjD/DUF883 family membrane-anchored ribosome-binding protein|uniref:DUF883 family protein n=1 Tax=Rhodoferax sediminis TaxID=2509614 RepID=A0A515D8F5_9BURK|nr:hypothetical protein [Rhodoferax sediminis]QDL36688.1 hypothetical protein EUB48_04780 [Rhodoferax sediminis]